jgi:hypothetical protein
MTAISIDKAYSLRTALAYDPDVALAGLGPISTPVVTLMARNLASMISSADIPFSSTTSPGIDADAGIVAVASRGVDNVGTNVPIGPLGAEGELTFLEAEPVGGARGALLDGTAPRPPLIDAGLGLNNV